MQASAAAPPTRTRQTQPLNINHRRRHGCTGQPSYVPTPTFGTSYVAISLLEWLIPCSQAATLRGNQSPRHEARAMPARAMPARVGLPASPCFEQCRLDHRLAYETFCDPLGHSCTSSQRNQPSGTPLRSSLASSSSSLDSNMSISPPFASGDVRACHRLHLS